MSSGSNSVAKLYFQTELFQPSELFLRLGLDNRIDEGIPVILVGRGDCASEGANFAVQSRVAGRGGVGIALGRGHPTQSQTNASQRAAVVGNSKGENIAIPGPAAALLNTPRTEMGRGRPNRVIPHNPKRVSHKGTRSPETRRLETSRTG